MLKGIDQRNASDRAPTPPPKKKKKKKTRQKSSATVYLHGAHVTSWTSPSGEELLFVSKDAIFKPPKAIRGGIPICFPQFGDLGPLKQQHGFARNVAFEVEKGGSAGSGSGSGPSSSPDQVTLLLRHDGASHDFPHPFELRVTVRVADEGRQLVQTLAVRNTSETGPLRFTAALHTYFRVSDISRARVEGLKGCKYLDSLDGRREKLEEGEHGVQFEEEVDRIYAAVPSDGAVRIVVDGGGAGAGAAASGAAPSSPPPSSSEGGRSISLETVNLPDAVVWNPWAAKASGMADFGDDEFRQMLCVEPAVAASGAVELAAGGGEHVCVQKLRLIV